MNLMLIRAGYPPLAVQPADRGAYIAALETGSVAGDLAPFVLLMHQLLEETLAAYLKALGG